jgi:hypothetical protein
MYNQVGSVAVNREKKALSFRLPGSILMAGCLLLLGACGSPESGASDTARLDVTKSHIKVSCGRQVQKLSTERYDYAGCVTENSRLVLERTYVAKGSSYRPSVPGVIENLLQGRDVIYSKAPELVNKLFAAVEFNSDCFGKGSEDRQLSFSNVLAFALERTTGQTGRVFFIRENHFQDNSPPAVKFIAGKFKSIDDFKKRMKVCTKTN